MGLRDKSVDVRLILISMLLVLVQCHAGPDECKKTCWKFAEMSHWEKFATESAGLESEAATELRAVFAEEWQKIRARDHDPGRDNCLMACRRSVTPNEAKCMMAAETTAAFARCQE